jgi:hypothetical protein
MPADPFKRKIIELKRYFISTVANGNENSPEASHWVSYQVAQAHFIAENLIGSCI